MLAASCLFIAQHSRSDILYRQESSFMRLLLVLRSPRHHTDAAPEAAFPCDETNVIVYENFVLLIRNRIILTIGPLGAVGMVECSHTGHAVQLAIRTPHLGSVLSGTIDVVEIRRGH